MGSSSAGIFFDRNTLPGMPELARQLIASFDDEQVDLNSVVALSAPESSLTHKILRLANAAHWPHSAHCGNVTSLNDAAAVLGAERLRNLVLAASIAGAFPRISGFDRIAFWRHAIATGGYARWFARILGTDSDSGYLAGCMLRTGQLLMALTLPEAIGAVESAACTPGTRMVEEQRVIGCTHAQVTAELARRWQLPRRLIDAFVHAPAPLDAQPFSVLAAVLHMATVMADAGELKVPAHAALETADGMLLDILRLDVPWLQSMAPSYEELTAPIAELLG